MNSNCFTKKQSFSFNTKHSLQDAIKKKRKLSEISNGSNSSEFNFNFANILQMNQFSKDFDFTNYNYNLNNNGFNNLNQIQTALLLSPLLQLNPSMHMQTSTFQQSPEIRDNGMMTPQIQINLLNDDIAQTNQMIKEEANHDSLSFSQSKEEIIKQRFQNDRIQQFLGENILYELFQDSDLEYYFPFGLPIIDNLSDLLKSNQTNLHYNKLILGVSNKKISKASSSPSCSTSINSVFKNEMKQEEIQKNDMQNQYEQLQFNKKQERKQKVERYLEKKRCKKLKSAIVVKYAIRKDLADNRKRIQGRFVKQSESRFKIDLKDVKTIQKVNQFLYTKSSDNNLKDDFKQSTYNLNQTIQKS